MSQAGKRWTVSELESLKKMHADGVSTKQMAVALQRNEGGIKSRLEVLGLISTVAENVEKELVPVLQDLINKYGQDAVTSCLYRLGKQKADPSSTTVSPAGATGAATRATASVAPTVPATPAVPPVQTVPPVPLAPLTDEQQRAFDLYLQGGSFCLTGPGGTGKSHLIKHIKEHCQSTGKKYAITALTGVAASLIGGQTLHAWTGLGLLTGTPESLIAKVNNNPQVLERWTGIEVLVIDEVSMMNQATFELLHVVAAGVRRDDNFYGGIQVMFCCDFAQLPPVEGNYAFESPLWLEYLGENTIYLEQILRQDDPEFIKMLMEVRLGRVTNRTKQMLNSRLNLDFPHDSTDIIPTVLYPHRKVVDETNSKKLEQLPGEKVVFTSKDSKYDFRSRANASMQSSDLVGLEERCPKSLVLCVGAQVMLTVNLDTDSGLVNGSRGVIVSFSKGQPDVRFEDGRVINIGPATFESQGQNSVVRRTQIPLVLAWATTIHKCQGSTLTHVVADLSKVFCCAQGYVTLSRMRSLDGLYLQNVDYTKFTCDRRVVAYYTALKNGEVYSAVKPVVHEAEGQIDLDVCML